MLIAEHRSDCGECEDPIEVGDEIKPSAFGWAHAEHRTRRPATVCPVCFLEQPCEC